MDQPLDREFHQPAEEAEVLDADDHRVEGLADPSFEISQ